MPSFDDVRSIAMGLPETEQREAHGGPAWRVRRKDFVWERPLRAADRDALGSGAPTGPVLGAYVEDLGAKAALLTGDPSVYFTTPHFDGSAIVLVRLDLIELSDLHELITEAWLARAPRKLAERHLQQLA